MQEGQINRLVDDLLSPPVAQENEPLQLDQAEAHRFELVDGSDPDGFAAVVVNIAKVFDFNPRRLKQFVNVFRLRVIIGLSTDTLDLYFDGAGRRSGISLAQLGLFTAITLRWPQLTGDLI